MQMLLAFFLCILFLSGERREIQCQVSAWINPIACLMPCTCEDQDCIATLSKLGKDFIVILCIVV